MNRAAPRARQHGSIPWHRRLESQLLLLVSLVVGCSLASALFVTDRLITLDTIRRASDDLSAVKAAFDRLVADRAAFAAADTRLITELPVFRAHLTDARLIADRATIQVMVEEYREHLAADFCVVTDPAGRWLASPGWPVQATSSPAFLAMINGAKTGHSRHGLLVLQGRLFLIVSAPAKFADEILGTLSAGYRFDDQVARDLARLARGEVNLLVGNAVSGSSLPTRDRTEFSALLASNPGALGKIGQPPELRHIGARRFVSSTYPIVSESAAIEPMALVLLQDWQSTEQFSRDISRRLIMASLLIFALTLAGGVLFSRAVTRPLRALADGSREIAAGNWDCRIRPGGSAEAVQMAEAFNAMTASLSHWHREAKLKAEGLQDAYSRLHAVMESAVDAIVSADREGRIISLNRAAQAMFGYSVEETEGRSVTMLMPERYRDHHTQSILRASAGGSQSLIGRTIELHGLRKGATEFPMEMSLASWRAGDQPFFTAFLRDVTHRQQLENQLRQSQKMDAIGRLAGGVAHDFNNLLTVILGYTDLVLGSLDPTDPLCANVNEVRKAGERAAALTKQLLAFSRKQALQMKVVDLNAIVVNTEKMLRWLIGEDIALAALLSPVEAWINADPFQIEQIIVNLVVNARDAMPGGGNLTIETSLVDGEEAASFVDAGAARVPYVMLAVHDTGCGMDSDTQVRVFEPFFTTKEPGQGTGLGLSTVYGIVRQSGGHITLESEPGRGTTFRIFLPRASEPPASTAPDITRNESIPATETVLLVEDDRQVRMLAAKVLESHGYRVLEADGPERARAIAQAHDGRIDLLVTDIVMPGGSGFDLAAYLLPRRLEMRVILITGYSDRMPALAPEGTAQWTVLQKPVTPADLIRAVRKAIAALPAAI